MVGGIEGGGCFVEARQNIVRRTRDVATRDNTAVVLLHELGNNCLSEGAGVADTAWAMFAAVVYRSEELVAAKRRQVRVRPGHHKA